MKIICWNLRNIGGPKLTGADNTLSPDLAALNLGSTLLEYIVKVVTGDPVWSNATNGDQTTCLTSNTPADIFVIIELKSGDGGKGRRARGGCQVVLPTITNALNVATDNNYDYTFMNTKENPLPITGKRECVGVIYNQRKLTYHSSKVLRDDRANYLRPKTPFLIKFLTVDNNDFLTIVGLHAPPLGGAPSPNKPPIDYCIQLSTCPDLEEDENILIMGDFNCSPDSFYYYNQTMKRFPFDSLKDEYFENDLPTPTLTSVKTELDDTFDAPANYLSMPYDNIFYKSSMFAGVETKVLDTIGKARNMIDPANPVDLTNDQLSAMVEEYFSKFSDHLPIQIEFDILVD